MQFTPTWVAGVIAFVGGIVSVLLGSDELGWALIVGGFGATGLTPPPRRNP